MKFSPNYNYVRLHDLTPPGPHASHNVKFLYNSAIEAEKQGLDADEAVRGSIRLDVTPTEPWMSPYGTDPATAEKVTRDYIATERSRLDRMEKYLDSYGGAMNVAELVVVRPPSSVPDADLFLTQILRRPGLREIYIHGQKYVLGSIPGRWVKTTK
jgi:hypothetical protein